MSSRFFRNFFTPIGEPIISGTALMPTTSGKRNEKDTCLFLFLFPFPLCRERSCARQRWRQKKETPKEQRCWTVLIGRLHLMHWPGPSCNWSPLNCRSLGNCLFFAPTLRLWLESNKKRKKNDKKQLSPLHYPPVRLYVIYKILRSTIMYRLRKIIKRKRDIGKYRCIRLW